MLLRRRRSVGLLIGQQPQLVLQPPHRRPRRDCGSSSARRKPSKLYARLTLLHPSCYPPEGNVWELYRMHSGEALEKERTEAANGQEVEVSHPPPPTLFACLC